MTEKLLFEHNLPRVDLDEARSAVQQWYGVDGEFQQLDGDRDLNFRVRSDTGEHVFKVGNANDDEDIVDFQVAALRHLRSFDETIPVPRIVNDLQGLPYRRVDFDGGSHVVHMMTHLPGVPAADGQYTAATWRAIGQMAGRINHAFASFFHPAARRNAQSREVSQCLRLAPLTAHLDTSRHIADEVFEHFRNEVLPQISRLRHQVTHQGIHGCNVLVHAEKPDEISGVIEFGGLTYAAVVADLAAACDTAAGDGADALEGLLNVVIGFDEEFALTEAEVDVLFDLVCARTAMLAAAAARNKMASDESAGNPAHEPYINRLTELLGIGRARCLRELRRACRFPVACPTSPVNVAPDDELVKKRYRYLGRRTTHFYHKPLQFERASGVYLRGTDGKQYLDCYNNVPQVGHCNPHVVRAISRQAAALNTNTRYLYSSAVEYAERLTAKLAPHLDACLFVNSGSEANDVAWQMAQKVSGNRGALIMEDAYHGITQPIRQFSPGHPDTRLPDFIQGLLVPDVYRGPYRGDGADIAGRYAADADRALAALADDGYGLAAFMVDSAFCSSGVPDVPKAYLRGIESRVRAAGGLMICDEVQSGFGRMGQWWGHEHHGVRADIVTLGKPVGNGHPLGVVVTTQEILNEFIDAVRLFSTFGGNTVACAAGNAVLDVIERDNLIEQGRETGNYLRESLWRLASTQPLIGDVRGHGMLAGLEFVTDKETRRPATQETGALLELMRQRQVLVGSEGRDNNILKLRPSLVFERQHVDQFIEALDDALTELGH